MAILYGTTGDGTTLPVLVDQFGNLLAKGIEGEPGTPGEPGPPGGSFPLPPDPYEGAFLGWLNNGLAWIGTPPVPIPEGVFGPITSWNPGGVLAVDGEIPSQVGPGVYVYQCNQDGSIFVEGWDNSQVWSSGDQSGNAPYGSTSWDSVFNGVIPSTFDQSNLVYQVADNGVFTLPLGISGRIQVYAALGSNSYLPGNTIVLSDGSSQEVTNGSPGWVLYDFGTKSNITSITLNGAGSSSGLGVPGILLDGELMVDLGGYPIAPNLNFRVTSVSGQSMVGSANRTDNFTIGKYLRVPEQSVARWLYDGNLSKVITSTGIDISRLNGI